MPDSRPPEPAASPSPRRSAGERRRTDRRTSLRASDEALAKRLRKHQQHAVLRHLPLAAGTAMACSLTLAAFTPAMTRGPLRVGWLLAVVALLLLQLRSWWIWRQDPRQLRATPQALRAMALHAGAFGALWASVPGWVLAQAGTTEHTLLVGSLTGMLCIGGVTLAALPMAACAYLGGLSASLLLSQSLAGSGHFGPGLLPWTGVLAVMVGGVLMTSRSFKARVQAELHAEHQGQLVGLLLRDFEERGSDMLWEIDGRGCLTQVATRLAEGLGRPRKRLEGRPLMDLLDELQQGLSEADRDATESLRQCLTEGHPFRDLLLPLTLDGQPRWWSLTAKPLVNERGTAVGWRGVARDVTQARQADRRLAWLAHYDTLTGVVNRAQFRVRLEAALQASRTDKRGGAVLCLDLDNFKAVNDTLGHPTGDALLVEVARRIQAAIDPDDLLGRLGGDQFAVLVRRIVTPDQVGALAQRILDALAEPCAALGAKVPVRVSIGMARFPQDGGSVDELMQNADLALCDAKTHAPGSVRPFVPRMGEQVRRRQMLERDLREALARGQLSLRFQPKVDLRSWTVTGFEALLRWQHPEHGEVPPTEFIPVAEESGLILTLGEWVLQQACAQAAHWPAHLSVAVNLSAVQVAAPNIAEVVRQALQGAGLPAERLELEITEAVFINESRGTLPRLHALRKLGVQIALDDFGTGYSSLAYLRRFPFDTLKIDRAFVRELLVSRDARAIVRNILALASSLRMVTVAEGVEEPAQVAVLADEGCDQLQGYYVARPLPADEVIGFVKHWKRRAGPRPPCDAKLADTDVAALPRALAEH